MTTFIFGTIAILTSAWACLATFALSRAEKFIKMKGLTEQWDKYHESEKSFWKNR